MVETIDLKHHWIQMMVWIPLSNDKNQKKAFQAKLKSDKLLSSTKETKLLQIPASKVSTNPNSW